MDEKKNIFWGYISIQHCFLLLFDFFFRSILFTTLCIKLLIKIQFLIQLDIHICVLLVGVFRHILSTCWCICWLRICFLVKVVLGFPTSLLFMDLRASGCHAEVFVSFFKFVKRVPWPDELRAQRSLWSLWLSCLVSKLVLVSAEFKVCLCLGCVRAHSYLSALAWEQSWTFFSLVLCGRWLVMVLPHQKSTDVSHPSELVF